MKIRAVLALFAIVAVAGWVAAPGFSEDEHGGEQGGESPWEALAKRGPEHAWMNFLVGSWNAEGKFWTGEDQFQTATGRMESHWILERRYVRSMYTGAWEGKSFRGEATMGFDNATKSFQTSWIDTMSTGMSRATGTRQGNVITLTGKNTMPMLGEVTFRAVYTKSSADAYTMEEFWNIPDQGEMKVMEIKYSRAD